MSVTINAQTNEETLEAMNTPGVASIAVFTSPEGTIDQTALGLAPVLADAAGRLWRLDAAQNGHAPRLTLVSNWKR